MASEAERIAKGLTKAQREALDRLSRRMVWIDMRSGKALVRRGLAEIRGRVDDAMMGTFTAIFPTPLGLSVRAILEKEQSDDADRE